MKRAESAPKDAEKLLGPASRGPGGKDVLQDAGKLVHKYGEDMTFDRNGNVTSHGGRGVKGSTGWEVRSFTADHLGSTRVVTDIAGTILEQFDYLPYGEKSNNSGLAVAASPASRLRGRKISLPHYPIT